MSIITRRKILGSLASISLLYPLVACGKGNLFMSKEITLDVVLFSYLDRPIFDVYLDGGDIGLAGAWPHSGKAVMTGVTIPLGAQTLTWRLDGPKGTPRNGETVAVKNSLILTKDQIPSDAAYLGVHIYSDDTAELIVSQYMPEKSERGEQIAERYRNHGK